MIKWDFSTFGEVYLTFPSLNDGIEGTAKIAGYDVRVTRQYVHFDDCSDWEADVGNLCYTADCETYIYIKKHQYIKMHQPTFEYPWYDRGMRIVNSFEDALKDWLDDSIEADFGGEGYWDRQG